MTRKTKKEKSKILNNLCKLFFVVVITIIIIIFGNFLVYKIHSDMSNLPKGDYLSNLSSPNGDYTLNAYLYDCGATCAYTLRVELVNNKNNEVRNIYWQYREKEADMKWLDNDNVEINGIKLNIKKKQFCKMCKD